ncbi:MAG TPA: hypothetical protein VH206_18720 [Xanthobacteraceae bacterium]|jgi:hypothetical protein|nr:hypothetical protein [Xanthobacteraceae bacterium]
MKTSAVNGEAKTLWILRNILGMARTKFGCGIAQCGAIAVHIDGRRCLPPAGSIGTKVVTTIERPDAARRPSKTSPKPNALSSAYQFPSLARSTAMKPSRSGSEERQHPRRKAST